MHSQLPVTAAILLLAGSPSATHRGHPEPSVSSAAWLAGCWALEKGDRIVEESWMPERGGTMLGMSRTSVAGQVKEHEFVLLRAAGSALEYRVVAGNQAEVVFRAASPSGSEVTFENLEHDFPKRIGYRRVSADSLVAWIDGGPNDKEGKISYPYHRVDCGGR
ncbi:MAG: DUF6265 family protein [Gemmatimonadales bacterium]